MMKTGKIASVTVYSDMYKDGCKYKDLGPATLEQLEERIDQHHPGWTSMVIVIEREERLR